MAADAWGQRGRGYGNSVVVIALQHLRGSGAICPRCGVLLEVQSPAEGWARCGCLHRAGTSVQLCQGCSGHRQDPQEVLQQLSQAGFPSCSMRVAGLEQLRGWHTMPGCAAHARTGTACPGTLLFCSPPGTLP